jgi:hypothetical protein
MRVSIFISHSCKDGEAMAPAGLTPAEAQARAERLAFAREIRHHLERRLTDTERYEVWLDVRGGLRPGDEWRRGIHRALRKCIGAVLLLSPEALQSGWVLKETTILVWRALLGEPVLVIPVRLGVSSEDLQDHGFDPAGIDAIQAETVREPTQAERERVVASIVERFDAHSRDLRAVNSMWSTTVGRWVTQVAGMLHMSEPSYAAEMFRILGLAQDDDRFDDPHLTVAGELLDSDPDDVLDVLNVVNGARTPPELQQLRRAVRWLWVSARAAHRLPHVASRPGLRLAAIDAAEPLTGEDYVLRAYCGGLRPDRVLAPDDYTDGTTQHALARITALLEQRLPLSTRESLERDIERNGPFYLVLGPSSCSPEVVAELARLYPPLTLVALTEGDDAAHLGSHAAKAEVLRPPLKGGEADGRRYRTRLECFI